MTDARDDTRLSLIRAAEHLFATQGIDAVSLLEVGREAEQRNRSAVQYHFKNREGLITAILERHSLPIQDMWLSTLNRWQATGKDATLRELVELLVFGIADKLDDADGGREFIEISAQMAGNPRNSLTDQELRHGEGAMRLIEDMLRLIDLPQTVVALRMERVTIFLFHSLAHCSRMMEVEGFSSSLRSIFVSDLVDTLVALIEAPVSERTTKWLSES